jgi:hypothetical protein
MTPKVRGSAPTSNVGRPLLFDCSTVLSRKRYSCFTAPSKPHILTRETEASVCRVYGHEREAYGASEGSRANPPLLEMTAAALNISVTAA